MKLKTFQWDYDDSFSSTVKRKNFPGIRLEADSSGKREWECRSFAREDQTKSPKWNSKKGHDAKRVNPVSSAKHESVSAKFLVFEDKHEALSRMLVQLCRTWTRNQRVQIIQVFERKNFIYARFQDIHVVNYNAHVRICFLCCYITCILQNECQAVWLHLNRLRSLDHSVMFLRW